MCENTITRINGNGKPYTVGMPKLIILGVYNDVAVQHIFENTGLKFTVIGDGESGYMEVQPENANQIVALFLTYNFKTRYYNNWQAENTIYLKSDHHVGFDVDSICYECVKHNRISVNGLSEDDRLSC